MTCSHDSERQLILHLFHDLCQTHLILGTASVRPSFEFYFMVCAAPEIRDEVGFALDSAAIQLFASISWFVPHMILGTRLHDLLT